MTLAAGTGEAVPGGSAAGAAAGASPYVVATAVGLGVSAAVIVSTHVSLDPTAHRVVLFAHLACVVVAFGAVLAIDWVGLLWVLRRRSLVQVLETAGHLHVPIWGGYAGLVASGALLAPDLGSPLTLTKVVLVFVIGWNGAVAARLQQHVSADPAGPGRSVLLASAGCALVSQAGWWGATVIGFSNAA